MTEQEMQERREAYERSLKVGQLGAEYKSLRSQVLNARLPGAASPQMSRMGEIEEECWKQYGVEIKRFV